MPLETHTDPDAVCVRAFELSHISRCISRGKTVALIRTYQKIPPESHSS